MGIYGHRSAFNIVYNGLPVQQLWQQLHNKRKRGYIPSISIQSNEVQYVSLVAVFGLLLQEAKMTTTFYTFLCQRKISCPP